MKFKTSLESYENPEGAQSYLTFLNSEDGQFFQQVLFESFRERLQENKDQKILDAACGPGWLSARLAEDFKNIEGIEAAGPFIEYAKTRYPDLKFTAENLNNPLPYTDETFDTIIMSMAAHDIEDQVKIFKELGRILKPGGKFMLTVVNPYYTFPVGVWKRGILGRLLFKKPKLKLRPYHWFAKQERGVTYNETLECYFYKLSEHLNHLREAGFIFEYMKDLESLQDSENYNLQYRLHRFPIFIYVEFSKPS